MSDLTPSVVVLDKGLDFYSSSLSSEVGSLMSCSNYEITDAEGLRRIEGMSHADGGISGGHTVFYKIEMGTTGASVPPLDGSYIVQIDNLTGYLGATTYTYVGRSLARVAAGIGAFRRSWVLACSNNTLLDISKLYSYDVTTGAVTALTPSTSIALISTVTAGGLSSANIANYMQTLNGYKTPLGDLAVGLHSHGTDDYAVAPFPETVVRGYDGSNNFVTGTYTLASTAGSVVGNSLNSAKAYIISSRIDTDGSGFQTYYWTIGMYSGTYIQWQAAIDAGATITNVTVTPGTAAMTQAKLSASDGVMRAASGAALVSTTVCSLWKAQSEQAAIASGVLPLQLGWRPIMTNFVIDYTNGSYASEDVPKSERSFATIPATATYYLTDGVNILSCELVTYSKDGNTGGTFVGGDANGTLQIKNLQVVAGGFDTIDSTYDIHTANPPLVGNKLADLSSTLAINGLPNAVELIRYNSRYEIISNNFYGHDSWEGVYGVNGVGRAFYYEGGLFATIFTQADDTLDKPAHVAAHHQHLSLGFRSGSVQLSVIGEPHNFSGLDGASEFGAGDRVTGLMPLNGTTLGVFCESCIKGISGTTVDNFAMETLSPNTGCLEYTLVDMGFPVFCNTFGINKLDQTAAYGNYLPDTLSKPVSIWLRPRLCSINGKLSVNSSVIAALPVRSKNQYRLYFNDGKVLTMTLGVEAVPKFTMQDPLVPNSGGDVFYAFALSSCIDSDGLERLRASCLDKATEDYSTYVMEVDAGWGWGSDYMDASFEINYFFGNSPAVYTSVQKARLYGQTHGIASLQIQCSGAQPQLTQRYNSTGQVFDLPNLAGAADTYYPSMVRRNSQPATLSNRGLAIQLKVSNRDAAVFEPPHVCQALILSTSQGGAFDV